MTSQQMQSKLRDAVVIIAECERYLERFDYAATGWEGVMLQHRVADFMDLHRDEQSAGGPS
jgi:hypothetical protein